VLSTGILTTKPFFIYNNIFINPLKKETTALNAAVSLKNSYKF
jgi:hypothetical protein